jgi:hypothetical protein
MDGTDRSSSCLLFRLRTEGRAKKTADYAVAAQPVDFSNRYTGVPKHTANRK